MSAVAELSKTGNERIAMGANMSAFDVVVGEIEAFYAEAKNWADGTPIASQDQHDAVSELYDALHKAGQEADALREAEKKPLDEQVKAIQAKYHPLIGDTKAGKGKVILGKASLNTMLVAWRSKVAADKAAAALKARQESDALLAAATAAIQSSAGNLEAREKAEDDLSFAQTATKFAARSEKAATTGNGLRTIWVAVLTDDSKAAEHYWRTRNPEFQNFLQSLADADAHGGSRSIPGFDVIEEKRAI